MNSRTHYIALGADNIRDTDRVLFKCFKSNEETSKDKKRIKSANK